MSNAMTKNARRVWDAFVFLSAGQVWEKRGSYVSVKSVADKCGMTKPTVRKYLRMATEQGFAVRWCQDGGTEFYAREAL